TQAVDLDTMESDTSTNNAKISADMTGVGGATYSTLQDMHNLTNSAGVLTGCDITDDGDGTITVSLGTCFIRATDDDTADLLFADVPANSGASLDLTGNPGGNPIYINYNSGTLQTERSVGGGSDKNTFIYLGSVYRDGTTLYITQTRRDTVLTHTVKMLERVKDVEPFALVSGCVLSEVGTRNIEATVGGWWDGLVETSTAGVNTSTVGTFESYYLDGVTSWSAGSTETQINNIEYSRGTPSAGTMSSGAYGVRWLYVDVEGNYHSLLGYAKGDFEEAQEETPPLPDTFGVPRFFHNGYARLIGKIIIEQGASTFHSIEQPFGDPFAKPLPSAAVTTAMLQDDAITTAKIAAGAVGTDELALGAVNNLRLADMPATTIKGNASGSAATPSNLLPSQIQTLIDYDPKLQSKAFCHFTTVASPVATGFNISGVSNTAVGKYRVSFTNAMSGTTYTVTHSILDTSGTIFLFTITSQTTGYFDLELKNGAGTLSDASEGVGINVLEYV
ncbi:MAG: hypothetical protein KAS19_07695, partial [Anaerolineales bacterium]|nr:hypothetical protein [Anaerolineales bacterium]